MSDNPYTILGVEPDASAEQIRGAYRRLARKLVWGVPVSSMFHMTYCPCCQ